MGTWLTLPNFTIAKPQAILNDGGAPVTMTFSGETVAALNSLDAASALFMSLAVANDYVIDPQINALTDWVMTMPTKQAYTAEDRLAPVAPATVGVLTPARAPFTNRWDNTAACEPVGFVSFDREESPSVVIPPGATGPIFSPAPPPGPTPTTPADLALCKEMSVLSFGADSALNATANSLYGAGDAVDGATGWATVSFDPADLNSTTNVTRTLTSDEGDTVVGLPVVGFSVQKYQNGNLGGVVANYAAAVTHKSVLSIAAGTP